VKLSIAITFHHLKNALIRNNLDKGTQNNLREKVIKMSSSVGISEDDFKQGMRALTAAVNVITTIQNGIRAGLTATAACSVSATPPQLLVCIHTEASGHNFIQNSKKFVLNILAKDQENIARRFAGMDGADRDDRFSLGVWSELVTGAPCLDDALVNFDCEVAEQITTGTHSIFIGHIVGSRIRKSNEKPLLYGYGQFNTLASEQPK
jgi:flavin reductase (DIM6/NTAB) family NADH-FMN oxidoreductase RutF